MSSSLYHHSLWGTVFHQGPSVLRTERDAVLGPRDEEGPRQQMGQIVHQQKQQQQEHHELQYQQYYQEKSQQQQEQQQQLGQMKKQEEKEVQEHQVKEQHVKEQQVREQQVKEREVNQEQKHGQEEVDQRKQKEDRDRVRKEPSLGPRQEEEEEQEQKEVQKEPGLGPRQSSERFEEGGVEEEHLAMEQLRQSVLGCKYGSRRRGRRLVLFNVAPKERESTSESDSMRRRRFEALGTRNGTPQRTPGTDALLDRLAEAEVGRGAVNMQPGRLRPILSSGEHIVAQGKPIHGASKGKEQDTRPSQSKQPWGPAGLPSQSKQPWGSPGEPSQSKHSWGTTGEKAVKPSGGSLPSKRSPPVYPQRSTGERTLRPSGGSLVVGQLPHGLKPGMWKSSSLTGSASTGIGIPAALSAVSLSDPVLSMDGNGEDQGWPRLQPRERPGIERHSSATAEGFEGVVEPGSNLRPERKRFDLLFPRSEALEEGRAIGRLFRHMSAQISSPRRPRHHKTSGKRGQGRLGARTTLDEETLLYYSTNA